MTELDRLYDAMTTGDEAAELAFYRALVDAELFLLLEAEAEGAQMTPRVFPLDSGPVLLAFDSEERLAAFADTPLPYVALPGRVVAAQMAGQGVSLGLNLGSEAASEMILPPDALDWLVAMLRQAPPQELQARPAAFLPPQVPQTVLSALLPALGVSLGADERALLAGVRYDDGRAGHMLALVGGPGRDEHRLARAVTEALAFSGLDAGALDLVFLAPGDVVLTGLERVALVLDGAPPTAPSAASPREPGTDPDRPPNLR